VSELEIITLTLSLVLGLSMAQLLSSVALAFRARRESQLHWIPLCWTTAIFLFHVQFWFVVYDLDSIVPSWTWDWYGPVLLLAVLLFLSGALILPTRDRELETGLLDDFDANGKYALVPLNIYLLTFIPMNVRMGNSWFSLVNAPDVVLGLLAAVALITKNPRARAVSSILYLALAAWAVLFLWSVPGN
jgi:hypothetical protein